MLSCLVVGVETWHNVSGLSRYERVYRRAPVAFADLKLLAAADE
jgi:hypothetical protein